MIQSVETVPIIFECAQFEYFSNKMNPTSLFNVIIVLSDDGGGGGVKDDDVKWIVFSAAIVLLQFLWARLLRPYGHSCVCVFFSAPK